jgi:hypothetical protein
MRRGPGRHGVAAAVVNLMALQVWIMVNPKGNPVVNGTGGLRKLRFAPARWRTGKRGALRVGHAYLEEYGTVLLIIAHGKNEKDDLTPAERTAISRLIREIERQFEAGVIE